MHHAVLRQVEQLHLHVGRSGHPPAHPVGDEEQAVVPLQPVGIAEKVDQHLGIGRVERNDSDEAGRTQRAKVRAGNRT